MNFADPLGTHPVAAAAGACAVVGLAGGVTNVILAGRKANLGTFAQGAIGGCALGAGAVIVATVALAYGVTGAASAGAGRVVWVMAGGPAVQQLIIVARQQYPRLASLPQQWHHVVPHYLGGSLGGLQVRIDPAYHQLITNAFRAAWPYGQQRPTPTQLQQILWDVYTRFPLPPNAPTRGG